MSTRRRKRHPGVVLLKPDPKRRIGHRARFEDPDTGKVVKESLDPALRTAELREDWAVRKSKANDRRRLELEQGAPRATGTALADAVARYYEAHKQLRDKTLASYRASTAKLLAWATHAGIKSADDLTRAKLLGFRELVLAEPKRKAAQAGKRGARRKTEEPRSPHSINRDLRGARVVLGYLAELDLLPRVHEGDLRRALKKLPVPVERTEYLKPAELARLLDAALAHDAAVFAATREELAGLRPLGSTAKFQPIAPFIACVLLTGMRLGEAVGLTWEQVDVDACDHDGKAVGEIHLTGATKTKRARTIGLEVSPALRELLAALKKKASGTGNVFRVSYDGAEAAAKRLKAEYGAPALFGWQVLRSTCGTYLTNAPAIFGAASAYQSAKQLGHSVAIAEKHYVGVIRSISRDARTLEAAMQIEEQLQRVIESIGNVRPRKSAARG